MTQHEEFEVGTHLDQTLRTALTGVAQLVERISRASSDRDRAAAQALREQLLDQRRARPERTASESLGEEGQRYLEQALPGPESARTAAAWQAAMNDVATSPSDPVPAAAAAQLNGESRARHGVDLAAAVAAAISDGQANAAQASTSAAASIAAGAELTAARVLPAYRDNPDRGVAPSKAATPDEATHRRQAWSMAKQDWTAASGLAADAAQKQWDDLPMTTKTDLYWKKYDTVQARTIGATPGEAAPRVAAPAGAAAERGIAPSKAPTAVERAHRENAWAAAQAAHAAAMPAGTTAAAAAAAWKDLEWQEKALRYWTAYDNPAASRPTPVAAVVVGRERVVELNEQAAAYFAGQATADSKGGQYLAGRLGQDVLDEGRWKVGYAPDSWTGLTDHLRRGGATDEEIVGAGLGRLSSRGTVVDAFRDRAVIGIHDREGQVVGFVGRDLSGSPQAPKYINTGQTEAYTKGDHLLGLYEAAPVARLLRTEGPFDAIAATAAGQGRYAGVAPLGTALTPTQADQLAERSGGRMWTALDADTAGAKATEEDYWLLSERGVDVRAVALPHGSDPAQLWHDNPALLSSLLESADSAPSAAVAVIDNTLVDLRDDLRAGDPAALEELAALEARVTAHLDTDDRSVLAAYTTARVNELLEGADQSRGVAAQMDVLDDQAEISAAASRGSRVETSATRGDDVGVSADQAVQLREQAAGRAGDLDAAAALGTGAPPTSERYDRGAVTGTVGAEAATARQVSGAGFSQPTRDMLASAQTRAGTPARPSTSTNPAVGRSRSQRR